MLPKLPPRQYDENLLAHGIVRPTPAPDDKDVFASALRLSGVKAINIHNAKPIEFLPDPEWTEDDIEHVANQLAEKHTMQETRDTIAQSLIHGRLAAVVLSTISAGTIVVEHVEPIISAALALLAAIAALVSKLREARK